MPTRRLARNLSFHLLWSSTLASGIGDRLAMLSVMVMLGYGAFGMAGGQLSDAAIAAGIDFFFFLPYVIWGPIAGWMADRLPRKWLLFAADELRGVTVLFAFTLLPAGESMVPGLYESWFEWSAGGLLGEPVVISHLWKVWGLMFIVGVLAATFNPARTSVIPSVVGMRWLSRANAVVISFGVIGNLLGFFIGGPLAREAVRWCVLCSALSYMVSGSVWMFLKTPAAGRVRWERGAGRPLHQIAQGLSYVTHHATVRTLVLVSVIYWGGTSVVMAAGAVIAVDLYGGDVQTFSYIAGAFGAGMLLGSLLLGIANSRIGGEVVIVVGMVGAGICLPLLVSVEVYALGIALALLTGVFGGMLLIAINTMLQQVTPEGMRGRVFGLKDMASQVAKVAVAGVIWQLPYADERMPPIAMALGFVLIAMAIYGTRRYLMVGPFDGPWYNLAHRVVRLLVSALHRLRVVDGWRMPGDGGVLLVSNHTTGLDPVLIQVAVRRPVRFLMGTENMVWLLGWMWRIVKPIPVKPDRRDASAAKAAVGKLRRGQVVGIFPEGGFGDGGGQMKPFFRGVAMIARRSGAVIQPVWVTGPRNMKGVWRPLLTPSRSEIRFGEPFTLESMEQTHASRGRADEAVEVSDTASFAELDARLTQHIRDQLEALRRQSAGSTCHGSAVEPTDSDRSGATA